MLTRNFMVWIGYAGMLLEKSIKVITLTNGNTTNLIGIGTDAYSPTSNNSWENNTFIIGTGKTEPKCTDYNLENEITEGYSCMPLQKLYVEGKEVADTLKIIGVIVNTGNENIEFTEIAWKAKTTAGEFILAREVYDIPIIISPGEIVAVSVNIM